MCFINFDRYQCSTWTSRLRRRLKSDWRRRSLEFELVDVVAVGDPNCCYPCCVGALIAAIQRLSLCLLVKAWGEYRSDQKASIRTAMNNV